MAHNPETTHGLTYSQDEAKRLFAAVSKVFGANDNEEGEIDFDFYDTIMGNSDSLRACLSVDRGFTSTPEAPISYTLFLQSNSEEMNSYEYYAEQVPNFDIVWSEHLYTEANARSAKVSKKDKALCYYDKDEGIVFSLIFHKMEEKLYVNYFDASNATDEAIEQGIETLRFEAIRPSLILEDALADLEGFSTRAGNSPSSQRAMGNLLLDMLPRWAVQSVLNGLQDYQPSGSSAEIELAEIYYHFVTKGLEDTGSEALTGERRILVEGEPDLYEVRFTHDDDTLLLLSVDGANDDVISWIDPEEIFTPDSSHKKQLSRLGKVMLSIQYQTGDFILNHALDDDNKPEFYLK